MPQSKGILRYNPDRSEFEAVTPGGELYGNDWPDDDLAVLADPTKPDDAYLAVLEGGYGGLQANTLYKLTPASTLVEEVDEFESDEDEDDDEDDEDEEDDEPEEAAK